MSNSSISLFEDEEIVEIVVMALLSPICLVLSVAASMVVKRNRLIADLVKFYVLVDLLNYSLNGVFYLFWATPTAVWKLNDSLPFLDRLFSTLPYIGFYIGISAKTFLGLNRCFAIAFDSRFSAKFESTRWFQYLTVALLTCIVIVVSWAIPGCQPTFVPYPTNVVWFVEGECRVITDRIFELMNYIFCPIYIVLDVTAFWLMRRHFRRNRSNSANSDLKRRQLGMEYRLAAMMLVNMLTSIALWIENLGPQYLLTANSGFIFYTGLYLIDCIFNNFAYLMLLHQGNNVTRVLPQARAPFTTTLESE
ncbi:unnamed protein product, partial [Mesorhabditis belari]|uniref:7TM GPCR serpentine receptor class x (Srx) domain-containing protein n=1 Tax=Mesorhabditis belari TaxID=2138241 RepID=A0AAF3JA75_9BILA